MNIGFSARYDSWLELSLPSKGLWEAQNLYRPSPMCEATDEPSFLKRGNKPMNPGFGTQIQGDLHFVKTGRHTVLLHPGVNELQQVQLLFCEHVHPFAPDCFGLFYSCSRFVSTLDRGVLGFLQKLYACGAGKSRLDPNVADGFIRIPRRIMGGAD